MYWLMWYVNHWSKFSVNSKEGHQQQMKCSLRTGAIREMSSTIQAHPIRGSTLQEKNQKLQSQLIHLILNVSTLQLWAELGQSSIICKTAPGIKSYLFSSTEMQHSLDKESSMSHYKCRSYSIMVQEEQYTSLSTIRLDSQHALTTLDQVSIAVILLSQLTHLSSM